MSVNGMRGSDSYGNQRPGGFGTGVKMSGNTRITREDVAKKLKGRKPRGRSTNRKSSK